MKVLWADWIIVKVIIEIILAQMLYGQEHVFPIKLYLFI